VKSWTEIWLCGDSKLLWTDQVTPYCTAYLCMFYSKWQCNCCLCSTLTLVDVYMSRLQIKQLHAFVEVNMSFYWPVKKYWRLRSILFVQVNNNSYSLIQKYVIALLHTMMLLTSMTSSGEYYFQQVNTIIYWLYLAKVRTFIVIM
jgi:hypothetical protein